MSGCEYKRKTQCDRSCLVNAGRMVFNGGNMAETMTRKEAIEAIIESEIESIASNPRAIEGFLNSVLFFGFQGYDTWSDRELEDLSLEILDREIKIVNV